MVHSFELIRNNNGNTTIVFYQDAKKRQIIFTKSTQALKDFNDLCDQDSSNYNTPNLQGIINKLRFEYLFKANVNNTSIFRPISKSLILKNS